MTHADIASAAPRDPLFLLWKIAAMWLADAIHAFGPPAEIAALIAAKTRRAVKRRIKALETLVMKLLLIEAGKLVPPASSRHASTQTIAAARADSAGWKPAVRPLDLAHPEAWRVRFDLRIPPEVRPSWKPPANSGPRIRDLGPARTVADIYAARAALAREQQLAAARAARANPDPAHERAKAHKLARRFEALKRAIANPRPYARRLLHKLHALKTSAYAAAMRIALRLPPPNQLNPAVIARADFHAGNAIPAVLAPPALDSS